MLYDIKNYIHILLIINFENLIVLKCYIRSSENEMEQKYFVRRVFYPLYFWDIQRCYGIWGTDNHFQKLLGHM
jgi:hypothetical protein